eukprot:Amastigsp_a343029_4.p2 type:complete len:173 gc:universal Amastigsp_a343029_4:83-601(+)
MGPVQIRFEHPCFDRFCVGSNVACDVVNVLQPQGMERLKRRVCGALCSKLCRRRPRCSSRFPLRCCGALADSALDAGKCFGLVGLVHWGLRRERKGLALRSETTRAKLCVEHRRDGVRRPLVVREKTLDIGTRRAVVESFDLKPPVVAHGGVRDLLLDRHKRSRLSFDRVHG